MAVCPSRQPHRSQTGQHNNHYSLAIRPLSSRTRSCVLSKAKSKHAGRVEKESSWEEGTGASIRVYHQTFIDIGRTQYWQMLKDLVPPSQWPRTAVVLASLESVYRVEFSKVSEETCAALVAADSAKRQQQESIAEQLLRTPITQAIRQTVRRAAQQLVWSFSSNMRGDERSQSTIGNGSITVPSVAEGEVAALARPSEVLVRTIDREWRSESSADVDEGDGGTGRLPMSYEQLANGNGNGYGHGNGNGSVKGNGTGCHAADGRGVAVASSNGVHSTADDEPAASGSRPAAGATTVPETAAEASTSTSTSTTTVGVPTPASDVEPLLPAPIGDLNLLQDQGGSSVDNADRRFLSLMAYLVRCSHFWQLSRRDAEIAKSLNADYLSQLFILGSSRKLDCDFVEAFYDASIRGQGQTSTSSFGSLYEAVGSAALHKDQQQRQQQLQQLQQTAQQERIHTDGAADSSPTGNRAAGHDGVSTSHAVAASNSNGTSGGGSGGLSPDAFEGMWVSRPPVTAADDPPPEALGMLIFKRGHALEVQRGQLLLAKLDYAQILLVRTVGRAIGAAARSVWGALTGWVRHWPAAAAGTEGNAGEVGAAEQAQNGSVEVTAVSTVAREQAGVGAVPVSEVSAAAEGGPLENGTAVHAATWPQQSHNGEAAPATATAASVSVDEPNSSTHITTQPVPAHTLEQPPEHTQQPRTHVKQSSEPTPKPKQSSNSLSEQAAGHPTLTPQHRDGDSLVAKKAQEAFQALEALEAQAALASQDAHAAQLAGSAQAVQAGFEEAGARAGAEGAVEAAESRKAAQEQNAKLAMLDDNHTLARQQMQGMAGSQGQEQEGVDGQTSASEQIESQHQLTAAAQQGQEQAPRPSQGQVLQEPEPGTSANLHEQVQVWHDLNVQGVRELLRQVRPQAVEALNGLRATGMSVAGVLSDWGLVPRLDVLPLSAVEAAYPVREPPGLPPKYIHKVALTDVIGTDLLKEGVGTFARVLLQEVTLVEPAYREVLVVYRNKVPERERTTTGPGPPALRWTAPLKLPMPKKAEHEQQVQQVGVSDGQGGKSDIQTEGTHGSGLNIANHNGSAGARNGIDNRSSSNNSSGIVGHITSGSHGIAHGGNDTSNPAADDGDDSKAPIQIQVYRDIPLPDWKLVLPDKLLQFRPLDLVRTDIFALAGFAALAFNQRYDSVVLEVVTLVSSITVIVRVFLGFRQMADRYRSYVNEVLQQRTVASGEGAIEFLANSAALQQFKQASLAYLVLLNHRRQLEQRLEAERRRLLNGQHLNGSDHHLSSTGSGSEWPGAAARSDPLDPWTNRARGLSVTQLAREAERLLRVHAQLQVRFDADEAAAELLRLGLAKCLVPRPDGEWEALGSYTEALDDEDGPGEAYAQFRAPGSTAREALEANRRAAGLDLTGQGPASAGARMAARNAADVQHAGANAGDGRDGWTADMRLEACAVGEGIDSLQTCWDALLWARVDSILREVD